MTKPAPVYLDHAATTPVRPEVLEAMLPYLGAEAFGNPSSAHRFGRTARAGLEQARREVAAALGCDPNQVVFTSGGTEADNLAIVGGALAARARGASMRATVDCSAHKAVLAAAHAVAHLGGEEELLPVDAQGQIDLVALDPALARKPGVVSVMWVNNETGAVQDIVTIGRRCEAAGTILHVDAVQAFGKFPIVFRDLPVAMLTVSGHKVGAPKGIAALVVRDRHVTEAIIHGGGQQFGIRPGTENVAGAVALGRAATLAAAEQPTEAQTLSTLRDDLWRKLAATVPDLVRHAAAGPHAPHILSFSVPGADSEALLMHLDLQGVCASSGSACATGAVEPSHVMTAMGIPRDVALGALRFSLGHGSTPGDVARVVEIFPRVVEKVRTLSVVLGRA